jgi:hypothetical protein
LNVTFRKSRRLEMKKMFKSLYRWSQTPFGDLVCCLVLGVMGIVSFWVWMCIASVMEGGF